PRRRGWARRARRAHRAERPRRARARGRTRSGRPPRALRALLQGRAPPPAPAGPAPPAELIAQSDRDVLARVVERDQAAHRVLFERYYKRVLAFVRRRVGDEGLAEGLSTDV